MNLPWQKPMKMLKESMPKNLPADRESQKRKRAEESKEQQGNRLEAKERKTAQLDEDPPGQRESKHIKTENDSDDDWVWDFDLDKVINAYQILVKKKQRFDDMYFIVKPLSRRPTYHLQRYHDRKTLHRSPQLT